MNIVDLSSESVLETLKAYATKDEYNNIMLLVNVEEAEITEAASGLIEAIKSTKNLSCRTLRNTLYKHEYKQDHNSIVNYDAGFIENTVKHL